MSTPVVLPSPGTMYDDVRNMVMPEVSTFFGFALAAVAISLFIRSFVRA
jgi:hypothetical protein